MSMPTNTRTPTRTDLVSALTEKIQALRNNSIDMTTVARELRNYAVEVKRQPSRGSLADEARDWIQETVIARAAQCEGMSLSMRAEADRLEERGVE